MPVERTRQFRSNTRTIPVGWQALLTSPEASNVFGEMRTEYAKKEAARLEAIRVAAAARLEVSRLEAIRQEQIAAEKRTRQIALEERQVQVTADQTELSLTIAYELHSTGCTTDPLIDSVLLARQYEGTKISQLSKKGEVPLSAKIRQARSDVCLNLGPTVSIIHETLDSLK